MRNLKNTSYIQRDGLVRRTTCSFVLDVEGRARALLCVLGTKGGAAQAWLQCGWHL